MALIFDTHAHYYDEAFDKDRYELIESLPSLGVGAVVNVSSTISSAHCAIELADKFDYIWAAVGIHPNGVGDANDDDIETIRNLAQKPRVVAIGEIGLDYYYDHPKRDVQLYWFEKLLELAVSLNLPVIVHDREAHEDTLRLLKKYCPCGVVHCFSGSVEMAREVISIGMHIGLGGTVTFKNAKKPVEVAAMLPIERLVLETDAPYLAPTPFRGKRCHSGLIAHTAARIAEIRSMQVDELLKTTFDNACRLFNISI